MPKISWNRNRSLEDIKDHECPSTNNDNNNIRTIIEIDPPKITFHSN